MIIILPGYHVDETPRDHFPRSEQSTGELKVFLGHLARVYAPHCNQFHPLSETGSELETDVYENKLQRPLYKR